MWASSSTIATYIAMALNRAEQMTIYIAEFRYITRGAVAQQPASHSTTEAKLVGASCEQMDCGS